MDKLKRALSGNEQCDEESGIITQIMDDATLSWSTRIKGFVACFVIGILLSILGFYALLLNRGFSTFAIFYSLGNIISLASTCFLMGPVNQIKKMFASTRIIATLVVIFSIVITVLAASHGKAALVLIFIVIQSLAMCWYSLSYIPYARDAVKKTVESCIT